MARWNFPGNQDGQVKGVADAGIEILMELSFHLWHERIAKILWMLH